MGTEIGKDALSLSVETPVVPTSVDSVVTHPSEQNLLPLELPGIDFIELTSTSATLTCEEIDGTPCSTSHDCGSCYPTPSCPLTPCYCGYGVCQCDI